MWTREVMRQDISIHAPLTGSDLENWGIADAKKNFNPRSPYGERRVTLRPQSLMRRISIHAPLTGSDKKDIKMKIVVKISIHAPLTGSDITERLLKSGSCISIHAPLTGSDSKTAQNFT